jgi:predicted transcriptional regulator
MLLSRALDEIAARTGRSKIWIVRQAVAEWLAEEQGRYELTLEALKVVDEGQTLTQEQVDKHVIKRPNALSGGARAT